MLPIVLFAALIVGIVAASPPVDQWQSQRYPHLTVEKVRQYEELERFLVGGGTQAIIKDASKSGCFDRIKIVNGKEVKNCYGTIKKAYSRTWECEELTRNTAPQCYGGNDEPVGLR